VPRREYGFFRKVLVGDGGDEFGDRIGKAHIASMDLELAKLRCEGIYNGAEGSGQGKGVNDAK
jgi:hypothetical protein